MATTTTPKKDRKKPERRSSVLDDAELRVIGRMGRDLDELSEEGQKAVVLYFYHRYFSDGQA